MVHDRDRIKHKVTSVAVKHLDDDLVAIYTYGSATSNGNYRDIDIMIVVEEISPEEAHRLRSATQAIQGSVSELETPLDLFVYSRDEIPSEDTEGYGIFTGFFQIDYRTNRQLLYGEDVLSDLPEIDIRSESLRMLQSCRRLLRHLLINPTPDTMLSRVLIGNGHLDFHHPISTETEGDVVSLVKYITKITCKCRLEADGIHVIGTHQIIHRFKEEYPEHAERVQKIRNQSNAESQDWTRFRLIQEALYLVEDCHTGIQHA